MDEKKLTALLYKKFVGKDKEWKPEILGINYANGFVTATDGFILAKVHFEEYDFDLEDRNISKNGSDITGKYPTFEKLFSDLFDTDILVSDLFKACKNLPSGTNKQGEFVAIKIEDYIFHTFQLDAVFELFELIQEIPKLKTGSSTTHKTLAFSSANCRAICISDYRTLTAKDLIFTIPEALEFQPSQKK